MLKKSNTVILEHLQEMKDDKTKKSKSTILETWSKDLKF